MTLPQLLELATNKECFQSLQHYLDFGQRYLEFIQCNLQAVIVSRNENTYRFFQYRRDGTFNVTRPINSEIMMSLDDFDADAFMQAIAEAHEGADPASDVRQCVNRTIYTAQQCIGATLDALPANRSNVARKLNGDLFERLILLVIQAAGVGVRSGNVAIPVRYNGEVAFEMKYQHDLLIGEEGEIRAIGSVKTSSKDRIDKIFVDKFLYNRLTGSSTPHFAIFLNDVQRKGREGRYGISATFLPGHFKGYTVKLCPLDGVYYFDLRPNMKTDGLLREHISAFDEFLFRDMWHFVR